MDAGMSWNISLKSNRIKSIARSAIPIRDQTLFPLLPADFRPFRGNFITGSQPAVLISHAHFIQSIRQLMRHELSYGMKSEIFGSRLKAGLNRLNEGLNLPPLSNCFLFNGYNENEFGLYTRAKYRFQNASLGLHYQIDSGKLRGTIAHELTHLEQDYLFICLLSDFLEIGSDASEEKIASLQSLAYSNHGVEPSLEKLTSFLLHRNGRRLNDAERFRAYQILNDLRNARYLSLISAEVAKVEKLLPRRWSQAWLFLNYADFLSSLNGRMDLIPQNLLTVITDALRSAAEASNHHRKSAGKGIYRLLRYYRDEASELSQDLLLQFRFGLYIEREAYWVGNHFDLSLDA